MRVWIFLGLVLSFVSQSSHADNTAIKFNGEFQVVTPAPTLKAESLIVLSGSLTPTTDATGSSICAKKVTITVVGRETQKDIPAVVAADAWSVSVGPFSYGETVHFLMDKTSAACSLSTGPETTSLMVSESFTADTTGQVDFMPDFMKLDYSGLIIRQEDGGIGISRFITLGGRLFTLQRVPFFIIGGISSEQANMKAAGPPYLIGLSLGKDFGLSGGVSLFREEADGPLASHFSGGVSMNFNLATKLFVDTFGLFAKAIK